MNNKWILRSLLIATLLLAGFYVYDSYVSSYSTSADVIGDLISDEDVVVTLEPRLTFAPADGTPTVGLVLYTAARVSPDAYASIANQVAAEGYLVVILKSPFNFPVLGASDAADVLLDYPEIATWIVGGHGMGGSVAAEFAERNDRVDGLVLIAALPGENSNLRFRNFRTLVVFGSQDTVAPPSDLEAAVDSVLPESVQIELIEGANHAQFGSYQNTDSRDRASITRQEQQFKTAAAILEMIGPRR